MAGFMIDSAVFDYQEVGGTTVLGNVLSNKNQYKYNGQEYQDEAGLNVTAMDYRQYDNALGRFHGVDLLSELDYSGSPYTFGLNNPVYWSDPMGLFEGDPPVNENNPIELDDVVIMKPKKKNNVVTHQYFYSMDFTSSFLDSFPGGIPMVSNGGDGGTLTPAGLVSIGSDPIIAAMMKYQSYSPSKISNIVNENNEVFNNQMFNTLIFESLKWENGDGFITVEEAINTWRYGRGKQHLRANLAQLDLSKVSVKDFPMGEGSTIWVNFASKKYFTNTNQAVIYGNISLTLINNNTVFVPYQDKYDFDIKGGWKNIRRDVLTVWGNVYNSFGIPYYITIYGTAKIKP